MAIKNIFESLHPKKKTIELNYKDSWVDGETSSKKLRVKFKPRWSTIAHIFVSDVFAGLAAVTKGQDLND